MHESTPTKSNREYRSALATLLLSTFMATLAVSSVNILLPDLVQSLGATYAAVQWVAIAYLIALAASLVIAGRLSDIYGRKPLFITGTILFTAGACLCSLADEIISLALFRVLQGIGAAVLIAVNLAAVNDIAPAHKVGAAIGLVGSMAAVGTASGPALGGAVAASFGWNAVFLINLPLGLLALAMACRYLPKPNPTAIPALKSFDFAGAVLLVLAIGTFAFGLKLIGLENYAWSGALLGCSALILAGFVHAETRAEARAKAPLLHLPYLRDAQFSISVALNFILSIVIMASLVIGPFYLTAGLGLSLAETGMAMTINPIVTATTSFFIGRSLSEQNIQTAITVGLVSLLGGAISLSLIGIDFGVAGYVLCLAMTAIGHGTFTAANNTAVMGRATQAQRGQISGVLNLSRNLGLLTGATLMSAVFDLSTRASALGDLPAARAENGLNTVYGVAILLVLIALFLRRIQRRRIAVDLKLT